MTDSTALPPDKDVLIDYTNWRGVRADRRIRPLALAFQHTDYHGVAWTLRAFDVERGEERDFAMSGVHEWRDLYSAAPRALGWLDRLSERFDAHMRAPRRMAAEPLFGVAADEFRPLLALAKRTEALDAASADLDAARMRIAELERQRDDLQAANNAYLRRAREAEGKLKERPDILPAGVTFGEQAVAAAMNARIPGEVLT